MPAAAAASSHFTPRPLLSTNSLSLSLSPSLTFCLALRASLLPHTTRYAGCYHTPRRTAPHRTALLTTTTPHLTTTPHSTLTTHHRRNTFCHRLGLSHSYSRHPPIHTLLHYAYPRSIAAQSRRVCRGVTTAYKREHSLYRHTTHTYKSTTDEMTSVDIDFTRRNKKPRLLTDSERDKLDEFIDAIHYSSR